MNRRTPLIGWLAAEAISLTGTRVSMIAIPWFVLTTTGSATQTGLVALAEMGPYVAAKALAGPVVDRVGAARVVVSADALSVAAVGAIPLLHALDVLSFPVLMVLVAVAGLLRGPADGAKHALVPAVAAAAEVPMERVTGFAGAAERLASTAGAAFAGVLVAMVGPATALLVDAASFAVSALLIAGTAPRRRPVPAGTAAVAAVGYLTSLREGWDFLRHDRVLVGITVMVGITNLLDQAYIVVLVPVWASVTGGGAGTIGLLFAVFSGASVLGSVLAAGWAAHLPRFWTYLVAFLLCGAPRFVVLAMEAPLVAVLATAAVGGFAAGFINPILSAVVFERIPPHLVGRVSALNTSLCWALIPFGGVVGGALIAGIGLSPALLVLGGAYLLATTLPALQPQWRELDARPAESDVSAADTPTGAPEASLSADR